MDTLKQTNEELKRCINKHIKCLEESGTLGKERSFSEVSVARYCIERELVTTLNVKD